VDNKANEIVELKDRMIYLVILLREAGVPLIQVRVSSNYFKREGNQKWYNSFKRELLKSGVHLIKTDLECNEMIFKVKV
jgi:hypothetical protein